MSQPSEPCVVVVWGDSIAASGWPQQMEFTYNVALNTGRSIRVINSGVGGKPASHARDEFDAKVAQHKPEVVFIQFGFNDMRYDGSRGALPLSTPEEFEGHMTHMVKRCKEELGAKVIVFGNHRVNRCTVLPSGLRYEQARAEYNVRARAAARASGAPWIDMSQVLALEETHWTTLVSDDGVHLSGAGLKAYASAGATAVMWLLQDKDPAGGFARLT